jgi:LmbE family N-acetylglucosaminyl deacetylase
MGTLVCLHAHPDDESIATGGTMARAAAEGHRVVLVVATDGLHGETPDDLEPGETLADRRKAETMRSAEVLGVARVEFLDYHDSGMTGWDANGHERAFANADVDAAAERVAEILLDERADVFTIYDWHGGYGHPDHVQVHRVGARAAALVAEALPDLLVAESTMNRDAIRRSIARAAELGVGDVVPDDDFDPDGPMDDGNPMGTPEAEITLGVDVRPFVDAKRTSIAAHRSQVTDSSFFLTMEPEEFADVFGTEWYVEHGRPPGPRSGWFFDGS